MGKDTLVIRADGNSQMGWGHLVRCCAVAQEWRRSGGEAIFLTCGDPAWIRRQEGLEAAEVRVARAAPDVDAVVDLAREVAARWVLVDGYHFPAAFRKAIQEAGFSVCCVDDNGDLGPYSDEVIINQNASAHRDLYPDAAGDICLGPHYALLRNEFCSHSGERKKMDVDSPLNVLLTLGGSVQDGCVRSLLNALDRVNISMSVTVVTSSEIFWEAPAGSSIDVQMIPPTEHMCRLMNVHDVLICGGGSTCLEACSVGLPALALILAENQRKPAQALADLRAIALIDSSRVQQDLESYLKDRDQLQDLGRRGSELVDGRGAKRLCRRFRHRDTRLRQATMADAEQLLEWSNERETRKCSFNRPEISLTEHRIWLEKRLEDDAFMLFIAEQEGKPVGTVRMDLEEEGCWVSINVDPGYRGTGLGPVLLEKAEEATADHVGARPYLAKILKENQSSLRCFRDAGYVERRMEEERGFPIMVMEHRRSAS